jgi:hypothetical protein
VDELPLEDEPDSPSDDEFESPSLSESEPDSLPEPEAELEPEEDEDEPDSSCSSSLSLPDEELDEDFVVVVVEGLISADDAAGVIDTGAGDGTICRGGDKLISLALISFSIRSFLLSEDLTFLRFEGDLDLFDLCDDSRRSEDDRRRL